MKIQIFGFQEWRDKLTPEEIKELCPNLRGKKQNRVLKNQYKYQIQCDIKEFSYATAIPIENIETQIKPYTPIKPAKYV